MHAPCDAFVMVWMHWPLINTKWWKQNTANKQAWCIFFNSLMGLDNEIHITFTKRKTGKEGWVGTFLASIGHQGLFLLLVCLSICLVFILGFSVLLTPPLILPAFLLLSSHTCYSSLLYVISHLVYLYLELCCCLNWVFVVSGERGAGGNLCSWNMKPMRKC